MGTRLVLFDNMADYELFEKETTTYPEPRVKISDIHFVQKIDLYAIFFEEEFNVTLNFTDVKEVRKLDKILNKMSIEDILKYKLGIIATIVKFMTSNTEGTYLTRLLGGIPDTVWVIMSDRQHGNVLLESPVDKFETEILDRYANGKKIIFHRYVSDYIKKYTVLCRKIPPVR